MTTRTQDEILDRFREADADDWLGFRREVLAQAMTPETLAQAIPGADVEPRENEPDFRIAARLYLDFATEKILGHRGMSAERSVDKLREYAWLLGRDDVVEAMDAVDYPQYGAPRIRAFAAGMDWLDDWPKTKALERMAHGVPCSDHCESGCGS